VWQQPAPRSRALWTIAGGLGAWHYVVAAVSARAGRIEAFDGGIQTSTISNLLHGQLPITDFYEPYGIGLGVPGLVPRLFGFDGVLAERLTYAVFGALATALAVVLVGRWVGGWRGVAMGALMGVMTLADSTPRYAAPWCALFGFALIVLGAAHRSATPKLRDVARSHPRRLDLAALILSLSGWMRIEYAAFGVLWAGILLVSVPGWLGRRRAAVSAGAAMLPSAIVVLTGGLRHLWWVASYDLKDFRHARGIPIDWGAPGSWLTDLIHGDGATSQPGAIVATYGVALLTLLLVGGLLLTPRGRSLVARADRGTGLLSLALLICLLVLYGQSARFSSTYGELASAVFALPAMLLLGTWLRGRGRVALAATLALVGLLILPTVRQTAPDSVGQVWRDRPVTTSREPIPGYSGIGMYSVDQERSLAALPKQWRKLGLHGESTLSIGRTNTIAWGNDTIVNALVDAPSAAWPLTYDPGLANSDRTQREVVDDLCRSAAPLVQAETAYPDNGNYGIRWGSPRLDEFVAVNYRVAAVAGFYRILLADRCRRPDDVSLADLMVLRDRYLRDDALPEAGATALARLRRSHDPDDAAIAVVGGFGHYVPPADLPRGAVGEALRRFAANARDPGLAARAVLDSRGGPAVTALAAQTAWATGHLAGEADDPRVVPVVLRFARRHPDLGAAVGVLRGVAPGGEAVFADLRHSGNRTLDLLRWEYDTAQSDPAQTARAVALGRSLIAAYDARRDPVRAAVVEIRLAELLWPTDPACSTALLVHADARPGIWLPPHGTAQRCRLLPRRPGSGLSR
jgi:hypothetical protein